MWHRIIGNTELRGTRISSMDYTKHIVQAIPSGYLKITFTLILPLQSKIGTQQKYVVTSFHISLSPFPICYMTVLKPQLMKFLLLYIR